MRNIGRLTEKYPRAARLYHIEVEPGEKDKRTCKIKTASIKWSKKEALRTILWIHVQFSAIKEYGRSVMCKISKASS